MTFVIGNSSFVIGHLYVGQLPLPHAQAQRPYHRRLLAGGRAIVLANPRAEAWIRSRRSAVGFHGDALMVHHAHAPRSPGGAAGVCGSAADDEDGAADHLPSRPRRGPRRSLAEDLPAARPRPAELR